VADIHFSTDDGRWIAGIARAVTVSCVRSHADAAATVKAWMIAEPLWFVQLEENLEWPNVQI
jgi:hypothetical protein